MLTANTKQLPLHPPCRFVLPLTPTAHAVEQMKAFRARGMDEDVLWSAFAALIVKYIERSYSIPAFSVVGTQFTETAAWMDECVRASLTHVNIAQLILNHQGSLAYTLEIRVKSWKVTVTADYFPY